jgi:hypothetical protein
MAHRSKLSSVKGRRYVWLMHQAFPQILNQDAMNFRFNIGKATEAACLFLERGGGQMNIMT